jgi:homoserine dehydrogenase
MEKNEAVRVGLLGTGTVGKGTLDVLTRNLSEITRRVGRRIEVTHASARDLARAASRVDGRCEIVADPMDIIARDDIDVVVELIGGEDRARELVLAAIANGKHVVTANKALLAMHGNEVFAAASKNGVIVAFEAAVAGGIPIIKAMREGLSANRIESIAGIINGTTNFILSEMRDKGLAFDVVLKQAQELGFAEADPTFDIDGVDAAHKLAIMAAIAFGVPVQFEKCSVQGIRNLDGLDIRYAEQLGYRIKLIGLARRRDEGNAQGLKPGIELRVHPTLIPERRLIANVEGPMNAVWINGDAVGQTMYYGQGAGAEETASAVVADLIDIARVLTVGPDHHVPPLAFQADSIGDTPILPIQEAETASYLRVRVLDKPGVLADITRLMADEGISLESVLQRETDPTDQQADIVLLTHRNLEKHLERATEKIQALDAVVSDVVRLRMEGLA